MMPDQQLEIAVTLARQGQREENQEKNVAIE